MKKISIEDKFLHEILCAIGNIYLAIWGIILTITGLFFWLGMTLTLTGLALAKGSPLGVIFTLGVTTPLNFLLAKAEEKELLEKFGVKYKSEKNSS